MKTKILIAFLSVWGVGRLFGQTIITDTIYFDTGGIDSYTNNQATTTNYGTDTSLWVYYDYGSPTKSYSSFLKGDYSAIPTDAIVLKATLKMYALNTSNGADHSMNILRLTSSWNEGTITHSNQPSTTTTHMPTIPSASCSNVGWQSFDISLITQHHVEFPTQNFGFRLSQTSLTGSVDKGVKYASTEHANSSLRPYIIIQYYVPNFARVYLQNGKDARVYSGGRGTNYGSDTSLMVNWESSGKANRTFLYADLSSIPRDAVVSKANLYMYAYNVDNTVSHPMYVEGVTSSGWGESAITWDNQPTVTSVNRSSITHSQTASTGWQQFSVTALAQTSVWSPEKNYGWRVALQSESGTSNMGVKYYSSEAVTNSRRPYLFVEYVNPIEIEGYVNHCSPGVNDGSITNLQISGGCGLYKSYNWYRYYNGTYTGVENGTFVENAEVSDLTDGLYMLLVTDWRGVTGHQFFMVGKENAVTNIQFIGISRNYIEDSFVAYTKATGDSTTTGGGSTTVGCHSSTAYNSKSYIAYHLDWDPSLEFTSCRHAFKNKGGCYQNSLSDNDAWLSIVTEPWGEYTVNWSNRPSASDTLKVYIPTTTVNGYEQRNDTIDILSMVPYWQEHPDEYYGIEFALNTYDQPQLAHRDYGSSDYQSHNMIVSFTVKPKIETVFHDSLGLGDITVNAPAGELPYTYLIGTDSLPDLSQIWNFIKDSTQIDSTFFFQGKSQTRNYVYSGLQAGEYFVGVYDNSGSKIFEQKTTLSPELIAYYTVNVSETDQGVQVASPATSGLLTFLAELPSNDEGGFTVNVDSLNGQVIVGLNKLNDTIPYLYRLFEYAIHYDSTGRFEIRKSGALLSSGTVTIGDQFKMLKQDDSIYVYKNGTVQYKDPYNPLDGDYKLEASLKGPDAYLSKPSLIGSFLKPKYIKWTVVHPDCPDDEGSFSVILPTTYFKYQFVSFSITDLQSGLIVQSGTTSGTFNLPIGYYSISWQYYTYVGGVYYTSTSSGYSEFTIGYPMVWDFVYPDDNMNQLIGSNTITPINPIQYGYATCLNLTPVTTDYWYSFNVSRKSMSPSYHSVDIDLSNTLGTAMSLHVEPYLWPGVLTRYVQLNSGTPVMVNNSFSFVIQSESSGFTVRNCGNVILPVSGVPAPNPISGALQINVSEIGKVYLSDNIVSFCDGEAELVYCTPFKSLQGGYYLVPADDVLHFEFYEEYTKAGNLNFTVKDQTNTSVTGLAVMGEEFGDNRYHLDVSSIVAGFYILEIRNDKNEVWYLRFEVQ